MNCLTNLVQCHFLKNIVFELKEARDRLDMAATYVHRETLSYRPLNCKVRKKLFNHYVNLYGFKDAFNDVDVVDLDMLCCLQEANVIFLACRSSTILKDSINSSLNVNGDVPLYVGKMYVQNKLMHVALYDLNWHIPPPTTN